jgi:hypothetical protein
MRLRLSTLFKNFSALGRLAKEQIEKEPKKGLEAAPGEVKASRLTPERGRCKKFGIHPLTLPSPRGGEGKPVEIKMKFPPS